MSSDSKINDIILITERLADVLKRENTALQNQQSQELHTLLDDKVTLSRVYETRMQFYNENPNVLSETTPELREKLRIIGLHTSELLQENAKLLKVAIEANRKVLDMIATAVKNVTPGPGTYRANGITGLSDH